MKFLNRKWLLAILGILVLVNVFNWYIYPVYIDEDSTGGNSSKPQVRLIVNGKVSNEDVKKIESLALDEEVSGKFNFAIIDNSNKNRLQAHVSQFKINGTKEVIVTDKSGKESYARFTDVPTKEQLLNLKR